MKQREIKFRAWDNIQKKMFGDLKVIYLPQKEEYGTFLMQFTGLFDKNGKEIYEGDVVKFNNEGEDKQSQIYWDSDAWSFKGKYYYGEVVVSWSDVEVIGNVYKNPELLSPNQI